jgi:hypothetical protein
LCYDRAAYYLVASAICIQNQEKTWGRLSSTAIQRIHVETLYSMQEIYKRSLGAGRSPRGFVLTKSISYRLAKGNGAGQKDRVI